jgi:hypothetical protein
MVSITAGNAAWDNPAMHRFEMPLGDGALAVAYYKVQDVPVLLLHSEVPQELRGLGYGSRLAPGVFEALRRDGRRVIAKCPDEMHARITLLGDDTSRLSNAYSNGISNFLGRVRSLGVPGRPSTRGCLDKD